MGVVGQCQVRAVLPPRKGPNAYYTGGCVVSSVGSDSSVKFHRNRDSIPGQSSP
jgi:hypothetical protein